MSKAAKAVTSWTKSISKTGEYVRKVSQMTGTTIPVADAVPGRYHVYAAYACPWAGRVLSMLGLKGLHGVISHSFVDSHLGPEGWTFGREDRGVDTKDPINGFETLRQVYLQTDPNYDSNVTVPVLYDKQEKRIINNESSEIIRILNTQFNKVAKNPDLNLYPEALRAKIDEMNDLVYPNINNGVYKCGFAMSQEAYDKNFKNLFKTLDQVEELLSRQRFLAGDTFTEADLRLFVTLVRFDAVYVTHFKCNKYRIQDKPALQNYTKEIYQMPGMKDVINFAETKYHYFHSHDQINPTRIVPLGPELDFDSPHNRADM